MKKTIYEGSSYIRNGSVYRGDNLNTFLTGLGAELVGDTLSSSVLVYHFQDVSVIRITLPSENPFDCRIDLVGEASRLGEVEKILLAEEERRRPHIGAHLGLLY